MFLEFLIPGGFGKRGTEGKIAAIKYARKTKFLFRYLFWYANGNY